MSIGDGELCETALTTVSVPEMFRYWLQGGRITVGFLGGAQIDRFANLNTTVVGPYDRPNVRLPGGGGAPEIATHCQRGVHHHGDGASALLSTTLPFITSLGHGEGGDSRGNASAHTDGRPDSGDHRSLRAATPIPSAKELTVVSLHPGVTKEQAQSQCGWALRFARDLAATTAVRLGRPRT